MQPEYGGDCVCYVTDNRPAAELAAALCFACKRRTGKLIPITISDNIDYRYIRTYVHMFKLVVL